MSGGSSVYVDIAVNLRERSVLWTPEEHGLFAFLPELKLDFDYLLECPMDGDGLCSLRPAALVDAALICSCAVRSALY